MTASNTTTLDVQNEKANDTAGKICFHLAENKNNSSYPFAFLATYVAELSKHLPLGRALEDYSGKSQNSSLLSLLLPLRKAAENSIFLKTLVDTGKIFKPLAWGAEEAYQFLKDIPYFESAGIMIRVPNWWNTRKPPRPTIKIKVGEKQSAQIGLNALLDFNMHFALPTGEELSAEEFKKLLN